MKKILFTNLQKQNELISVDFKNELDKLMDKGDFILGEKVAEFEKNFANFIHSKFAIGVGNGSDALEIILLGLGIGPGDEVIVPALTYIASASSVVNIGAKPVFIDVDDSGTIDHNLLQTMLNKNTKAIILVHLYGNPANIEKIKSICDLNNVALIEDAAQAHGAYTELGMLGSIGEAGAFSFYPGKNLGAFGDAGIITTSNPKLFEKMSRIRNHGRLGKYDHDLVGRNSRLDSVQALFLNLKLKYLQSWNFKRSQNYNLYKQFILNDKIRFLNQNKYGSSVYHQAILLVKNKLKFTNYLKNNGITYGQHYPYIIPQTKSFFDPNFHSFSKALEISTQGVSIPIAEHLQLDELEFIIEKINFYE